MGQHSRAHASCGHVLYLTRRSDERPCGAVPAAARLRRRRPRWRLQGLARDASGRAQADQCVALRVATGSRACRSSSLCPLFPMPMSAPQRPCHSSCRRRQRWAAWRFCRPAPRRPLGLGHHAPASPPSRRRACWACRASWSHRIRRAGLIRMVAVVSVIALTSLVVRSGSVPRQASLAIL